MDPLVAAIGGSVFSGYFNQRSANKSMRFSSAQAARQMQFQDEQSRTQYQRAVTDMKKAGINPMLAAKLGGNAAMSGAMGSGAQATMPDLGATINSATSIANQKNVQDAQVQKLVAEATKLIPQQIQESIQKIAESVSRITVNDANKQQIFRTIDKIGSEIETMASSRSLMAVKERLNISQTDINGIIYGLKQAELPAAWAAQEFWNFLSESNLTVEAKAAQFAAGLVPLLQAIPDIGISKFISNYLSKDIPQRPVRIKR